MPVVTEGRLTLRFGARKTKQVDGGPKHSYSELIVWQRALECCIAIYRLTQTFPREELYGLTNQFRRAAVSVPSNTAEGYGRLSRDQYRHFLGIAQGSNFELQTHLQIARGLQIGEVSRIEAIERLSNEVGKMLTVMIRKLSPPATQTLTRNP